MKGHRLLVVSLLALALFPARPPGASIAAEDSSRVAVTLVLLDTVVTDRRGNPVAGLAVEDFDLLIDNVRSPIESLEEKCRPDPGVAGRPGPAPAASDDLRHFILLFDMTHLKATSRRDGIKSAIRFVDEVMTDRDRTMVLAFKRGLHVVSRFSGDRTVLKGRLEELLENRALVDTAAFEEENRLEQIARSISNYPRRRMRGLFLPDVQRQVDGAVRFECEQEARSAEIETTAAIRAFANTMPAFGAVRGRKAILFFTETLRADPAIPFYDVCGMSTLARPSLGLTVQPEIQDLARQANLAGVSFYPIHAAGMMGGRTNEGLRSSRDFETGIALATGGKNFVLMNDTLAPFRQAARDLSCHYVLAYRPPDGFAPGDHVLKVFVRDRSLRVRHRQYFTIQRPEEASDGVMLAALSSPGIYRGLKVEGQAYSLAGAERGRRDVLLKASIPMDELALAPISSTMARGSVHVRGGVISPKSGLACEFSRSVSFVTSIGEDARARWVGLEALCSLPEGDDEIVVAARDETGGAIGTFWGRIQVKGLEKHGGPSALLWAEAWPDIWDRHEKEGRRSAVPDGLFLRDSFTLRPGEPGALTLLVCAGEAGKGATPSSPVGGGVLLRGPRATSLPAREIPGGGDGRCRALRADIPSAALSTGSYEVAVELSPPWLLQGSPVRIKVE